MVCSEVKKAQIRPSKCIVSWNFVSPPFVLDIWIQTAEFYWVWWVVFFCKCFLQGILLCRVWLLLACSLVSRIAQTFVILCCSILGCIIHTQRSKRGTTRNKMEGGRGGVICCCKPLERLQEDRQADRQVEKQMVNVYVHMGSKRIKSQTVSYALFLVFHLSSHWFMVWKTNSYWIWQHNAWFTKQEISILLRFAFWDPLKPAVAQ